MKKLMLSLLAIGMMGSSIAQMAIPAGIFANDPTRFNGRKVTLKNVQLDFNDLAVQNATVAPPGPIGTPTTPVINPCRPPRGFTQVKVFFLEEPAYDACFFMANSMYEQLKRETGGVTTDARITLRGDSRIGYHISFYRLGQ